MGGQNKLEVKHCNQKMNLDNTLNLPDGQMTGNIHKCVKVDLTKVHNVFAQRNKH